jgi:vacuolar-type H+-ATPase subunit I/STV1
VSPFWLWWLTKGWPWLKKNWMWVLLFPVALLAFLFGRDRGKVVVVDERRESDAARDFERKVEERRQAAVGELDRQLVERTGAVVQEHREELNKLTEEQRAAAEELLGDPDALRSYLLQVGSRARG